MAFNVALYGPDGHAWAMTERSARHLHRSRSQLRIGESSLRYDDTGLVVNFDEVFLPWPGQRWVPKRMRGEIQLTPNFVGEQVFELDKDGSHLWQPIAPSGRVKLTCDSLPGGGWSGEGYHDMNWGSRPLEEDFNGWDWARGKTADGRTVVVYDSVLATGENPRFGLRYDRQGAVSLFDPPARRALTHGFWGVGGGIVCDETASPGLRDIYEDTPFYRRSLVETRISGDRVSMMHETLDCRRLAMPLVRLMLPFRMPRRA